MTLDEVAKTDLKLTLYIWVTKFHVDRWCSEVKPIHLFRSLGCLHQRTPIALFFPHYRNQLHGHYAHMKVIHMLPNMS